MADSSAEIDSWDQISQQAPMDIQDQDQDQDQDPNQPRSTFNVMYSQAQNDSQFQTNTRKRSKPSISYSDVYTDSEYDSPNEHLTKRRNTQTTYRIQPTLVTINSPDVKLSRINPIKIAKALNNVGKDYIKNVNKNNQGGITVTTDFAKSETQSKGVITGIEIDITESEMLTTLKKHGVIEVKRLMRRRDGKLEKSLSLCLTFNTPNPPTKIQIGYEYFTVKPFIPPVIRCFNCQRLGHTANNCRSSTRCVRCGGPPLIRTMQSERQCKMLQMR